MCFATTHLHPPPAVGVTNLNPPPAVGTLVHAHRAIAEAVGEPEVQTSSSAPNERGVLQLILVLLFEI